MIRKLTTLAVSTFFLLSLSATAGDKPSCCAAKGKTAAAHAKECDHERTAAASKTASCETVEKKDVALTGKLLCEHCNLQKSEKCSPVFQAEGREGYLPLCPETKDVASLKAAGDEGKVVLDVKGVLCKTKDGKEYLQVTSFTKKG
jgi:hypothetical protein